MGDEGASAGGGGVAGGARPGLLKRLVMVEPHERVMVMCAAGMFFCLMSGYGVVKPLREAMGVARGVDKLPWLMTGTLVAMTLVNPLFAMMVSRMDRRRFVPLLYRFFIGNLAVFAGLKLLAPENWLVNIGYAFYIWLSVFNLLALSVFWGLMADVFSVAQGKRLFGLLAVGGTVGLIAAAAAAEWMATTLKVPPWGYFAVTAVLLEAAVWCGKGVMAGALRQRDFDEGAGGEHRPEDRSVARRENEARPSAWSGIVEVFRSPYFAGICAYLLIYVVCSSVLYVTQQKLIAGAVADAAGRTALNARIDFWANTLTLAVQLLLTGRIVKWIGLRGALAVTPVVTLGVFGALGASPTLGALQTGVVTRRGLHYAVDKPAREMLYTGLSRDSKYKTKSFIDTVIYRGGDVVGAWAEYAVKERSLPAMVLVGPLCVLGVVIGWLLARAHGRLEKDRG